MVLDAAKTVREVAVAFPQAAQVFEKTIDYSGGGNQLPGDACAKAKTDLQMLKQMLEASVATGGPGLDLQPLTLAQLIKYILDTHHIFRDEMERLEGLVAKVCAVHGAIHWELLSMRNLLQGLFAELKNHMFKEEQILFPFILKLEESRLHKRPAPFALFGTAANPIRVMIFDHDKAGEILYELRKLSRGYRVPEDACISYKTLYQSLEVFEQDLHQHMHLENNILFPKAIALETS